MIGNKTFLWVSASQIYILSYSYPSSAARSTALTLYSPIPILGWGT